jgi:hypothetical protein
LKHNERVLLVERVSVKMKSQRHAEKRLQDIGKGSLPFAIDDPDRNRIVSSPNITPTDKHTRMGPDVSSLQTIQSHHQSQETPEKQVPGASASQDQLERRSK